MGLLDDVDIDKLREFLTEDDTGDPEAFKQFEKEFTEAGAALSEDITMDDAGVISWNKKLRKNANLAVFVSVIVWATEANTEARDKTFKYIDSLERTDARKKDMKQSLTIYANKKLMAELANLLERYKAGEVRL